MFWGIKVSLKCSFVEIFTPGLLPRAMLGSSALGLNTLLQIMVSVTHVAIKCSSDSKALCYHLGLCLRTTMLSWWFWYEYVTLSPGSMVTSGSQLLIRTMSMFMVLPQPGSMLPPKLQGYLCTGILHLALCGSERWTVPKTTSILMSFSSIWVLAVIQAWAALKDHIWLWSFGPTAVRIFTDFYGSFYQKRLHRYPGYEQTIHPCWWLRVRMLLRPCWSMWPAMSSGYGTIVTCGLSCSKGICLILQYYCSHGL